MRLDRCNPHVPLRKDELMACHQGALVVCRKQSIAIRKPQAALTAEWIVDCNTYRQEKTVVFPGLEHLEVGDIANDG